MSRKRKRPQPKPRPATRCNGCGGCCDPVISAATMLEIKLRGAGATEDEAANNAFIKQHWTQLSTREGFRRAPWFAEAQRGTVGIVSHTGAVVEPVFYECDMYDTETRLCKAYEERPPVCDGYPYYGGPVNVTAALPPACEFLLDRGVTPEPVEVMLRRRDGSVIA